MYLLGVSDWFTLKVKQSHYWNLAHLAYLCKGWPNSLTIQIIPLSKRDNAQGDLIKSSYSIKRLESLGLAQGHTSSYQSTESQSCELQECLNTFNNLTWFYDILVFTQGNSIFVLLYKQVKETQGWQRHKDDIFFMVIQWIVELISV